MKSSKKTSKKESIADLQKQLLNTEKELSHFKEMNAQFDLILSHTIPMCMIDKDFNILHINRSYSEMFNRKTEDIIGSKCYDDRPGSKCHTSSCPLTRLKKEKLPKVECECGNEWERKIKTPLIIVARPFYDKNGKFAGAIETVHDITSRKNAEIALLKNDQFLNTILDTIQDGISVLDTDFNILKVNKTMKKWHTDKRLVGEKCYKVYHNRKTPCKICPTTRALKTGNLEVDEVPLPMDNGETGILELYSFPMKNDHGKTIGIVEYVRNITERKRAEESRLNLITELHNTLSEVKTLRGILPLCSYCKNIRNDKGYWEKVDVYIHQHSEADVSHGICPDCLKIYFPKQYQEMDISKNKKTKK